MVQMAMGAPRASSWGAWNGLGYLIFLISIMVTGAWMGQLEKWFLCFWEAKHNEQLWGQSVFWHKGGLRGWIQRIGTRPFLHLFLLSNSFSDRFIINPIHYLLCIISRKPMCCCCVLQMGAHNPLLFVMKTKPCGLSRNLWNYHHSILSLGVPRKSSQQSRSAALCVRTQSLTWCGPFHEKN